MWGEFIDHPSIYARHFMDFSAILRADEIQMFSDASKSPLLRYGDLAGNSWLYGQWDYDFIIARDPSIAYLELYALAARVLSWIHRFRNRRVILFCDNQSVVHMVNSTSSSCHNCMVLIHKIVLTCLKENVRLFAKYVPSKMNVAADYLSRLKIQEFRSLKKSWDALPTVTPEELLPMSAIWKSTSRPSHS